MVSAYGTFYTYDSRMAYPLRFKRVPRILNEVEFEVMTDSDAHIVMTDCKGTDMPGSPMYELGEYTISN